MGRRPGALAPSQLFEAMLPGPGSPCLWMAAVSGTPFRSPRGEAGREARAWKVDWRPGLFPYAVEESTLQVPTTAESCVLTAIFCLPVG